MCKCVFQYGEKGVGDGNCIAALKIFPFHLFTGCHHSGRRVASSDGRANLNDFDAQSSDFWIVECGNDVGSVT